MGEDNKNQLLIYAFQGNIIANGLITEYFKWFNLAHKSRNKNNTKEDFSQFNDDDIMAEESKTFGKELAIRYANYDIGTYEGYLMSKIQEVEEQIRLNPELEPLNPKNLNFDDWLKEERSKEVSFLTKNGFDMPILAEIFGVSINEVASIIDQIEAKSEFVTEGVLFTKSKKRTTVIFE